MLRIKLIFTSLILILGLQAQSSIEDLSFYADVLVNAAEGQHRVKANSIFEEKFDAYINSSEFDAESVKQIKYVSQKSVEGADFTVYTWQLKKDENTFQSFGYIWKNDGTVFKLNSVKHQEVDMPFEQYGKDNWLGVLYYNMIPTFVDGEEAWLLFGYDGYSKMNHRKVLDVLTFGENGEPVFGAEIFKKEKGGVRALLTNRIVLTYSMDSNVSLNFDPDLEIIIHDHLINRIGRIPGQGETWLADGSYEGYAWDGTHWTYDEKVFDHVTAEGDYPRPKPVLDSRKEARRYKK